MPFEFNATSAKQLKRFRAAMNQQNSKVLLMIIATEDGASDGTVNFCAHTDQTFESKQAFIENLKIYISALEAMVFQFSEEAKPKLIQ
jgi:hypothetical protein